MKQQDWLSIKGVSKPNVSKFIDQVTAYISHESDDLNVARYVSELNLVIQTAEVILFSNSLMPSLLIFTVIII